MMIDKPSALDVIGRYVDLRRAGKEHVGLCPFHAERRPSFSVSDALGLFYCFGCGESGDVVTFVMKIEKVRFRQALSLLKISVGARYSSITAERRKMAQLAAAWAHSQQDALNALLVELYEQRDLADEIEDVELEEVFDREITILRAFYDSLRSPVGIVEMLSHRPAIEELTAW